MSPEERIEQTPRRIRARGRGDVLLLRRRRRSRRYIEHDFQQVDARHSIDHAVMDPRDHRAALALEAVDEKDVPQRLAAIHHRRKDAARELDQLGVRAGRVDLNAPDVIGYVEIRIEFPGRMADIERVRHHLLLVAREQVQLRSYVLHELVERYFAFKDAHASDVHRGFLLFEVKEGRVHRGKLSIEIGLNHYILRESSNSRLPVLPSSPLQSHLHAVLRAEGNERLHLDRVVGHEAHLPPLRERGDDQYTLHPGELLADAEPRAAAEREVANASGGRPSPRAVQRSGSK